MAGVPPPPLRMSLASEVDDDDLASTPRRREFLRRSSNAPLASEPLLQVAASVNGRLGLATSTVLSVTQSTISYSRYEIPIDQIERAVRLATTIPFRDHDTTSLLALFPLPHHHTPPSSVWAQGYDETTCTLLIKFAFRSKPKHFQLDGPSSCRAVCQLLSQVLEEHDRAHGNGDPRTPEGAAQLSSLAGARHGIDRSGSALHSYHQPGGLNGPRFRRPSNESTADSDISEYTADAHQVPPPPEWLVAMLETIHTREWGIELYVFLRSGWCCRTHYWEAIIFGVLMPLAIAGYWLADASFRESRSSGSNHWLPAACDLHNPLVVSRQVYHHGKYADAKDLAYQEGVVWRLEPAFNTSVELLVEYGRRYRFSTSRWPQRWDAVTMTSVVEEERPHCDGQVMDSTEETRARCDETAWIPQELLTLNGTQPCFVDRSNRNHVYLNIEDPGVLYFDLLLIFVCFSIAASIAACLASQHKSLLLSWWASFWERWRGSRRDGGGNGAEAVAGAVPRGDERRGGDPTLLTPESIKSAATQVKKSFVDML